jgi:large subunit ribosomal protein L33
MYSLPKHRLDLDRYLDPLESLPTRAGRSPAIGNDFHYQIVTESMSHSTLRPVIKLRSTAGTGYTYVTRKSRRNDPDRLVIRKYDPVIGRHVEFREER